MRIAFVVSHLDRELPLATTLVLAHAAHTRGHTVHLIEAADLTYFPDGHVGGTAWIVPPRRLDFAPELLAALRMPDTPRVRLSTAELDVLWLRYNPSDYGLDEHWAAPAGIRFAQLAMHRGVLVLDHPDTLAYAENKMYLQHLPEPTRPRTLITRSLEEIERFRQEQGGRIVLKPLGGFGGSDVFLVGPDDANLPSLVESMARRDFIIAQEYLPNAPHGDVRLFMMNGRPLVVDGHHAAIRRVNDHGDFRSNMTAGGRAEKTEADGTILALTALVGPKLREDGVFLAGLDIVGDRLVEINTLCPGGLYSASRLAGVDFASAIVQSIERKLEHRQGEGRGLDNRALATWDRPA